MSTTPLTPLLANLLNKTFDFHANGCRCAACNPNYAGMIVCGNCGNKRCPHATHHDQPCTSSNTPGQPGSRFHDGSPTVCKCELSPQYLAAWGQRPRVALNDGRSLRLTETSVGRRMQIEIDGLFVPADHEAVYETLLAQQQENETLREQLKISEARANGPFFMARMLRFAKRGDLETAGSYATHWAERLEAAGDAVAARMLRKAVSGEYGPPVVICEAELASTPPVKEEAE